MVRWVDCVCDFQVGIDVWRICLRLPGSAKRIVRIAGLYYMAEPWFCRYSLGGSTGEGLEVCCFRFKALVRFLCPELYISLYLKLKK